MKPKKRARLLAHLEAIESACAIIDRERPGMSVQTGRQRESCQQIRRLLKLCPRRLHPESAQDGPI